MAPTAPLFITKVETERLRLFRWGQAVGLTDGGEVLLDPAVRRGVTELLAWAVVFFEDAAGVGKRHARKRGGLITFQSGQSRSRSLGFAASAGLAVIAGFENPRDRAGKIQKESSALRKMRWAFSGKSKAERLVQELGWFIDRLYALVPAAGLQVQSPMSPPHRGVEEVIPQQVTTNDGRAILRLTSSPGAIINRVENRRLQSMIRRRRMKYAIRTAAGAMAEAERKIRANERYVFLIPHP
jgi:hypothetical protein